MTKKLFCVSDDGCFRGAMFNTMSEEVELTVDEAWAIIELGGMILFKERKFAWKEAGEWGAYIPIRKAGYFTGSSDPIMDTSYWGGVRAYYSSFKGPSYSPHKSPAEAKKLLKQNFRKAYKRTASFRVAVNQFLQGEQS